MYGYESYKSNDIETASQIRLIVMLYDGALRFINIGRGALESKNFELANKNIIKAQNIVSELIVSLNFEAGGLASDLYNLYIYIHRTLLEANIQKSKTLLEEASDLLINLKSGWDILLSQESTEGVDGNINISG